MRGHSFNIIKMKIRKSRCEDINEIMNIISIAKEYMIVHGNPTQWGADYPGEEVLKSDIMNNNSYVIMDNGRDSRNIYIYHGR